MTAVFERFEGKAVLVTGAGTGFGAELAVRAAQEGARVAVHYNRCVVRYSTHDMQGLTETDFQCASAVDALLDA